MLKKWIITLMACMIAITSFVGCNNETSSSESTEPYVEPTKYTYTEGVHDYTAPVVSDKYIVKNGTTDYKILVPNIITNNLRIARDELVFFFKEATGITLSVETENEQGKTHSDTAKYLSIGDTKAFQSTGITLDKNVLGPDGCRVVTKDNTVYITGTSDEGALFAVYDFLKLTFNYEWYDHDYWEIDTNVVNVNLRDFNVFDRPDFDKRRVSNGITLNNVNNAFYRARNNWYYWDNTMPIGDTTDPNVNTKVNTVHNSPLWLPANAPTTKTEWISTKGVQLCYTARGDAQLYEEMVDRLAFVLIDCLKKYPVAAYPKYDQATLTMEDEYPAVCDCSGCRAAREKYGSDTGAVIVLCNNVMAKARAWMDEKDENGNYVNEKYRRENFTLRFFAYSQFVKAPAHYDEEQGKYVVNHPDLIMRDDVAVWHAINSSMQYQLDLYSKENKEHFENSTAWFDISPNANIWTYAINYWEPQVMFDSFNHYTSDLFQWYKAKNVDAGLQDASDYGPEATAFQALRLYLVSNLYWDCTLDDKELTDKWFNAMYKDGAPYMKQLFNDMRANAMKIWNDKQLLTTGTIASTTLTREYYSKNQLSQWMEYCDKAIAIIREAYKNNPELQAKLVKNVEREWISPAFCALKLYSGDMTTTEYQTIKNRFKALVEQMGDIDYAHNSSETLRSWVNKLD